MTPAYQDSSNSQRKEHHFVFIIKVALSLTYIWHEVISCLLAFINDSEICWLSLFGSCIKCLSFENDNAKVIFLS